MKRGGRVAIGIGAGVVVALFIAWQVAAAAESHGIVITTDAKPFVCENPADVTTVNFQGRYVAAIRLARDVNCEIRIRVYNDGVLPADISSMRFDILGRDAPTAYVYMIEGQPSRGGINATGRLWQVQTLQPGSALELTARVKLSHTECMSVGGSGIFDEAPQVGVSVLGLSVPRNPTDVNLAFVGTKQSSFGCGPTPPNPSGR